MYYNIEAKLITMRSRLMVGRLTLDQEIGVRIPAPQQIFVLES